MQTPVTPPVPEPTVPVLLIVFNRPQPTRCVLDAIRSARPMRLYIAADGPRPGQPGDAVRCAETRALVTKGVDWPCAVKTYFRDENRGCGLGPAEAISWFFEHEPEGIILEDDCVPAPSFFRFCGEMLARYRFDSRVMHIGGGNFTHEARLPLSVGAESYHFSGRVHSWAWATWRRAWQHFDFHLTRLPEMRKRGVLAGSYPSLLERAYWMRKFEAVRREQQAAHIWDYQWHFAVAAHGGITIVPAVNLVTNIGFGEDATHTLNPHDQLAHPAVGALTFPLIHPPVVSADKHRDRQHFREHLARRALSTLRRFLNRLLPTKPLAPVAPESALAQPFSV